MSDVIYNISSGFFDSVNGDRLYSAGDMNKPYKRVIADGIFPTPQGTPSTDFQVVAVSGMSVAVLAGNAMIGARWAENTDDVGITIAGNSSSSPRIDSIFLHIDTGMDTRAAGVVYRQGTAAGTPTAPAMVQTDNITELRLADILVAPSAAIITQANITDQRGGSDCPWVAGLIQQVDTSALFDQYRAAYAEQQQDQAAEWNTFMDHLARDYDISMSLRKHESTYTSTAAASLIPINIDGYDTTKDLLQVYINGIFAVEGTHYIVKSAAQIQLTNAISAGQNVHFVIYKAVMGGAQPIIPTDEQVQDAVDAYMDAHPGALVVDPELSDTSTHAIQNKAVTEALAGVNGRLDQYEGVFTGDVDESVKNWLDDHPEATTTVQDGSLTEAKFSDALRLKTIKDYVTLEMFGAVADDASVDNSPALQACITAALSSQKPIVVSSGSYTFLTPITLTRPVGLVIKGEDNKVTDTGVTFSYNGSGDFITIYGCNALSLSGIKFIGGSNGNGIVFADNTPNSVSCRANNVNFKSLTFTGFVCDLSIDSPTGYVYITNCTFETSIEQAVGISIGKNYNNTTVLPNYIYIDKCRFADKPSDNSGLAGIYAYCGEFITITKCDLFGYYSGHAICIDSSVGHINGITIAENVIFENLYAVQIDLERDHYVRDITILGNQIKVYENGIGIKITGTADFTVKAVNIASNIFQAISAVNKFVDISYVDNFLFGNVAYPYTNIPLAEYANFNSIGHWFDKKSLIHDTYKRTSITASETKDFVFDNTHAWIIPTKYACMGEPAINMSIRSVTTNSGMTTVQVQNYDSSASSNITVIALL